MTTESNESDWKRRLLRELTRDKKKTAILAVLLLVGCIVGLRLAMKSSPASAGAAQAPGAMASGVSPVATVAPASVEAPPDDPDRDARLQAYLQKTQRLITRDLFEPDAKVFPPEPPKSVKETPKAVEPSQKSPAELVNDQAKDLRLQSTMISAIPTAILNDQVVRVGGRIAGFTVVKITPRSCEVMKDGVTVTLHMSSP